MLGSCFILLGKEELDSETFFEARNLKRPVLFIQIQSILIRIRVQLFCEIWIQSRLLIRSLDKMDPDTEPGVFEKKM